MFQELLRRIFHPFMNERGFAGEAEDVSAIDAKLIEQGYEAEGLKGMSAGEKQGLLVTDNEIVESEAKPPATEAEEEEIPEEDLEAIAGEDKPGDKPADEKPASPPAESPAPEVTDEDLLTFRPVVAADELPKVEISKEVPAELKTKLDELDDKYDEGEMSLKDYNRERDAINRDIYEAQADARDAAKEQVSTARQEREAEKIQGHFLNTRGEMYLAGKQTDPQAKIKASALYGAFAKMVEAISLDPKTANLGWMETLIMADKAVRETFGITKPTEKPAATKDTGKPPAKMPDVVTLADIPNAGKNSTGGDPFAALDKLTGEEYEAEFERLMKNPAYAAAYEKGASIPSRRRVA